MDRSPEQVKPAPAGKAASEAESSADLAAVSANPGWLDQRALYRWNASLNE
jgi:hypothetical protein